MILGPVESYELLLHMGMLPKTMKAEERRRIKGDGMLLPFPQSVQEQDAVLGLAPKITSETDATLRSLGLTEKQRTAFVQSAKNKRKSKKLRCMHCGSTLPANSILHVANDVYILSPALCLLLLARMPEISDIEIAFAISQLCSRYAHSVTNGELIERIPHTSIERIHHYVDSIRKLNKKKTPHGIPRLLRLLQLGIDATRSPREIGHSLLMSLPIWSGRKRIPEHKMNQRIELSKQEQAELGKQYVEVDFSWEACKTIIEYNGGLHADQREEDSARTNVLRDKGYEVAILTKRVMDNCESYLKFMRRIETLVGFEVPRCANDFYNFENYHRLVISITNNQGMLLR